MNKLADNLQTHNPRERLEFAIGVSQYFAPFAYLPCMNERLALQANTISAAMAASWEKISDYQESDLDISQILAEIKKISRANNWPDSFGCIETVNGISFLLIGILESNQNKLIDCMNCLERLAYSCSKLNEEYSGNFNNYFITTSKRIIDFNIYTRLIDGAMESGECSIQKSVLTAERKIIQDSSEDIYFELRRLYSDQFR